MVGIFCVFAAIPYGLGFLEKAGTLFMLFGGPDNGKYEVSE
jgi:hypothetical protein